MQFSKLIGQEEAKQHILATIRGGRMPHALMLKGPAGIGKLGFASAIAQYVNCLQPTETDSCGRCASCIKISRGIHPDVRYILPIISKKEGGRQFLTEDYFSIFRENFFNDPYFSYERWQQELDGNNKQMWIAVHEIRALKRAIFLKAFEAKYKVVIIWNAERINISASNAFLKLLEEPPDRTLILMTCSDPSQLLPTINSRCQRMQLHRITAERIRDYLHQQKGLTEQMATEIAAISEGSIGNADRYSNEESLTMNRFYVDWLRAVYSGNYAKIGDFTSRLASENTEFQKMFIHLAIKKIRDSFLYHSELPDLALVTHEEHSFQEKFSPFVTPQKSRRILHELDESYRHISGNANSRMVFSALAIRLYAILRGN